MNDKCPFRIKCMNDCKYIKGPYTGMYHDYILAKDVYVRNTTTREEDTYLCTITNEKVQPREDKTP